LNKQFPVVPISTIIKTSIHMFTILQSPICDKRVSSTD
jgi:hypothetical protein